MFVTFSIVTRVEHVCCSQVMAAAATVSKLSTTVCGICKVATTNTGNALVSKEFRRFMTRMTDSTATLLECTEVSGYKYINPASHVALWCLLVSYVVSWCLIVSCGVLGSHKEHHEM